MYCQSGEIASSSQFHEVAHDEINDPVDQSYADFLYSQKSGYLI
jgi:hypothetical protein